MLTDALGRAVGVVQVPEAVVVLLAVPVFEERVIVGVLQMLVGAILMQAASVG